MEAQAAEPRNGPKPKLAISERESPSRGRLTTEQFQGKRGAMDEPSETVRIKPTYRLICGKRH